MFKRNDFIKWTSTDDHGEFSHVGQLIDLTPNTITLQDQYGGVMAIPLDEGTFNKTNRPSSWDRTTQKNKPTRTKKDTTPKRTPTGTTKVEQIVHLLREHSPQSRKEAIAMIVDAGITTQAGASTMYNTARKLL